MAVVCRNVHPNISSANWLVAAVCRVQEILTKKAKKKTIFYKYSILVTHDHNGHLKFDPTFRRKDSMFAQ